MAKGFTDSNGKFRPTGNSSRRSSREKSIETKGMKINNVDFSEENWGFETEDGKITKLRLGNWTTAGWHWDGDDNDIIGFLVRINSSEVNDDFLEKMRGEGITFTKLKPLLLTKVDDGSWLYELTGDNNRWHFHNDNDIDAEIGEELDYYKEERGMSDEDVDTISEELSNVDLSYEFEEFEKDNGDWIKKEMKQMIKDSDTFEQFFEKIEDLDFSEQYFEGVRDKISNGIFETIERLKMEGKINVTKGELLEFRSKDTEKEISEGLQARLA